MDNRDPHTATAWVQPECDSTRAVAHGSSRIGCMVLDPQGDIAELDPAAMAMLAGADSDLMGRPLGDLVDGDERSRLRQFMDGLRRGETVEPLEIRITVTVNEARRLRLERDPERPSVTGWALRMTDLDALRMEQGEARRHLNAIARAARLNSLVEMASGMAHELSQPLSAIVAYARAGRYLLQMDTPQAREELDRSLEKVGEQAERAAEIIRRIRGSVQKEAPQCARHPVTELVQHALAALEDELREGKISVRVEEAQPGLCAWVDGIAVEQVLVNLLRNAMESIVAAGSDRRVITVTVSSAGPEQVEIGLSDTGEGTVGKDPEQWFMPFSTSRRGSLGLSLSLSRSLVEIHGGRLWAEASDSGGTQMRFTLPTAPE